jgi:hypothetical protein
MGFRQKITFQSFFAGIQIYRILPFIPDFAPRGINFLPLCVLLTTFQQGLQGGDDFG